MINGSASTRQSDSEVSLGWRSRYSSSVCSTRLGSTSDPEELSVGSTSIGSSWVSSDGWSGKSSSAPWWPAANPRNATLTRPEWRRVATRGAGSLAVTPTSGPPRPWSKRHCRPSFRASADRAASQCRRTRPLSRWRTATGIPTAGRTTLLAAVPACAASRSTHAGASRRLAMAGAASVGAVTSALRCHRPARSRPRWLCGMWRPVGREAARSPMPALLPAQPTSPGPRPWRERCSAACCRRSREAPAAGVYPAIDTFTCTVHSSESRTSNGGPPARMRVWVTPASRRSRSESPDAELSALWARDGVQSSDLWGYELVVRATAPALTWTAVTAIASVTALVLAARHTHPAR